MPESIGTIIDRIIDTRYCGSRCPQMAFDCLEELRQHFTGETGALVVDNEEWSKLLNAAIICADRSA